MKKFSKIICIICVVVLLAALTACADKSLYKVACSESLNRDDVFSDIVHSGIEGDLAERFDTVEQLNEFCNEKNIQVNNNEEDYKFSSAFRKKFENYNNKYFNDKSLIVVFRYKPCLEKLTFKDLQIENDALTVNILNESKISGAEGDSAAVITIYVYLIEVKKSAIENVEQIQVVEMDKL